MIGNYGYSVDSDCKICLAFAVMSVALVIGVFAIAINVIQNKSNETAQIKAEWDAAVVIKICTDGTRIYRMPSGKYRMSGLGGSSVSGPEVCQ